MNSDTSSIWSREEFKKILNMPVYTGMASVPEWESEDVPGEDKILVRNNRTGKTYKISALDIALMSDQDYAKIRHVLNFNTKGLSMKQALSKLGGGVA